MNYEGCFHKSEAKIPVAKEFYADRCSVNNLQMRMESSKNLITRTGNAVCINAEIRSII